MCASRGSHCLWWSIGLGFETNINAPPSAPLWIVCPAHLMRETSPILVGERKPGLTTCNPCSCARYLAASTMSGSFKLPLSSGSCRNIRSSRCKSG